MTISGTKKAALLATLLGASVLTAGPAAAEGGLLGILFGDGNRMNRPYSERFPRQKKPEPAAKAVVAPRPPVARVSGPTFYTYKAASPVRVDFSKIAASGEPLSLEGATFRDALPGLADFDLKAEKAVADAIVKYYSANPDFIWISGFGPNGRARQAANVLEEAGSYGLSPGDYEVAMPPQSYDFNRTAARFSMLMQFEMEMSARVLRYALDAHGGRVDPNKLSGYHDLPAKPYDLVAVLDQLSKSADVEAFLTDQHPQNPEYRALRQDLVALQASPEEEIAVRPDMLVRPGGSDPDFPLLLEIIRRDADPQLLEQYGDLIAGHAGSEIYGNELVPLVKAVQKAADLHPDGIVGPRTVKALAGESTQSRIRKVELALERLRWLPSRFGNPHVLINAAGFTAAFNQDGRNRLLMRAVVGRKTNQTSFFYDEIEYVEFNPYWGVPRSIIINEMLPRLVADPGYLDRAGYEVTDSKGRRIPSAMIDWSRVGARIPYNIRQVPSEQNALGELKIMFPNKHAIYMHDTPQKSLFRRDMRAFSHGCVRLQEPREMAAAVLDWSKENVAARLKQGHNQATLKKKIPVYVAYFTAWPDDTGKVSYYDDIYDRDSHLETALEKVEAVRQPSMKLADGAG